MWLQGRDLQEERGLEMVQSCSISAQGCVAGPSDPLDRIFSFQRVWVAGAHWGLVHEDGDLKAGILHVPSHPRVLPVWTAFSIST